MSLDALVGLLTVATFVVMLIIELIAPARTFDRTRAWVGIGTGFFVFGIIITALIPVLVPLEWVQQHALLDGTRLSLVAGTLVGVLVGDLTNYWTHRAAHKFNLMWRLFHQLHHSPARVDVPGSFYFHPFDILLFTFVGITTNILILGLDPRAVALANYAITFVAIFQHWNVRTPHWLGYIIQRPESHYRHHERDVHAFNYANIPMWDMVFGTYYNPRQVADDLQGRTGFDDHRRRRFWAILFCRDVHADTPAFTHFDY